MSEKDGKIEWEGRGGKTQVILNVYKSSPFFCDLERKPAPNIVLNIQTGASHHGPEDFERLLEEEALKLAFLYTELGLDPPRPSRRKKRSEQQKIQQR